MAGTVRRKGYWTPALLTAPALLLLAMISLFPLAYNLVASVQRITMTDEDTGFAGLVNYGQLVADQRFREALGHTLLIGAVALPVQLILGVLIALLFQEHVPGRRALVALLMLPAMISPIVAGASWKLMFDGRYGPINQMISWATGAQQPLLWTITPTLVYPAILIVEIWQHTPFVFLLVLAALANIDPGLREAAAIDGAGPVRTVVSILLPTIAPVLGTVALLRALDLFRLFDIVWALTRGGPGTMTETVSTYIYQQGFEQFETSYTAAMAFAVMVGLGLVLAVAMRAAR